MIFYPYDFLYNCIKIRDIYATVASHEEDIWESDTIVTPLWSRKNQ